jgi:hypothetical protein
VKHHKTLHVSPSVHLPETIYNKPIASRWAHRLDKRHRALAQLQLAHWLDKRHRALTQLQLDISLEKSHRGEGVLQSGTAQVD